MNERYWIMFFAIVVLCATGLIAQCSHRTSQCQTESIKANVPTQDIARICRA